MKDQGVILSIYFEEENINDLASFEYHTAKDVAEEIINQMVAASSVRLFRLGNKLINLSTVKFIKYENIPDEYDIEDNDEN